MAISNYVKNCQPMCTGVGGGWTRIVHFNITAGDNCTSTWTKGTQLGVFVLQEMIQQGTCAITLIFLNEITYTSVCSRARGYQKGDVYSFWASTASHSQ